jgi:hypothetical protein
VAISEAEFAELARQADQQRLEPTDMPCSFYVTATSETDDADPPDAETGLRVAVPGAATIELSSRQPLADVTIGVRSATDATFVELGTAVGLVDGGCVVRPLVRRGW